MPPKRKSTRHAAVDPEPEVIDWNSLTVAKLREELETRQLDSKGNKAALIERLEEWSESASANVSSKSKKAKLEPKSEIQKAIEKLKKDGTASTSAKVYKIDARAAALGSYEKVHEDYSFMLNQTFIQNNNNKFYVGQILESNGKKVFEVFTKWGRVGEPGQVQQMVFSKVEEAIECFEKKFTDKTGNKWENRHNFQPKAGKYTLIETEADDEQPTVAIDHSTIVVGNLSAKSSLDHSTQELVNLIFDNDMFNDAMKGMNLDTKKMPLGKLSKTQIAKGFQVLEQIETELKAKKPNNNLLCTLSNEFYTVIPHDFARTRPPVIKDLADTQTKFDMLITLSDIEQAQEMQKAKSSDLSVLHPSDIRYDLLKCKLNLLDNKSQEFKVIEKYFANTKGPWNGIKSLRNVWSVDRNSEDERFKVHDKIDNRKLLWHGTNVAVVAAILKSGLRIMPHSGGRVGRGIYFASENAKSAGYTRPARKIGLMFLNEVALGKEREIDRDDSSLQAPPSGYDSVVARGQQEPDPDADTVIQLGGKNVIVPQGQPKPVNKFARSSFSQSEYLIYRENQVRIRYLLAFDWSC